VWEAPVNDDGYPHDAAEVRRAAWGDMTAGVMPVYFEWYWDFFKGNGKGEPDVRRMFDFFYTKTRYGEYRQLNQLVSKSARQIPPEYADKNISSTTRMAAPLTLIFPESLQERCFRPSGSIPKPALKRAAGALLVGLLKPSKPPFPETPYYSCAEYLLR